MKATIVLANLEISGTFRYLISVARAFRELGWEVQVLYSGVSPEVYGVGESLSGMKCVCYAGPRWHFVSRLLQAPLIKLFAGKFFSVSQGTNILGQIVSTRRFLSLTHDSAIIVYANFRAVPMSLVLRSEQMRRSAVLFHESVAARNLPRVLRQSLQRVARSIASKAGACISISNMVETSLRLQGISSTTLYPAFSEAPPHVKANIVLADTRWHANRDPRRVVSIAAMTDGVAFVLTGRIHPPEVALQLEELINQNGLEGRVEVRGWVSEEELRGLYAKAKVVARWGVQEEGFPASIATAVSNECIPVISSELGGAYHLAKEVSPELVADSPVAFGQILKRLFTDTNFYEQNREKICAWKRRRPWTVWVSELLSKMGVDASTPE